VGAMGRWRTGVMEYANLCKKRKGKPKARHLIKDAYIVAKILY
jgi:hypothetical protein